MRSKIILVVKINGANNSKSIGNNTELVSIAEMPVNVLLFNLMWFDEADVGIEAYATL